MDTKNRFHTAQTWLWVRAEHLTLVVVLVVLLAVHLGEVNWLRFVVAFAALDIIGYIPGAFAYRRAGGGRITPFYHHLYNLTHSYLTAGVVAGVWALTLGGFEWAMLALPIHLSGDRGLFGNTYKPTALPFEPAAAPGAGSGSRLSQGVPHDVHA
ncbi:MAG TPA: hypothetical protein VG013_13860 [Gemmataceae bacterium]|jgi:hypothetical protein|nr:hypothetical protein [Gemmataceae bacterium]